MSGVGQWRRGSSLELGLLRTVPWSRWSLRCVPGKGQDSGRSNETERRRNDIMQGQDDGSKDRTAFDIFREK